MSDVRKDLDRLADLVAEKPEGGMLGSDVVEALRIISRTLVVFRAILAESIEKQRNE